MTQPKRSRGAGRFAALLPALALALARAGPALALEPGAPIDQYAHTAWPRVENTSAVGTLLMARDGHLWIGTAEGLVRFDGQAMVPFDRQRLPGIVAGNIERMFEASDGALWVGSRDGGLSRVLGMEVSTPGGLPVSLVRDFAETADGAIWVGTFGGVVRFARGSRRPEPMSDGLADKRVDTIAVDGAGVLWAGTRGGLARWDPEARRWRAELGPLATPARVHALLPQPDGALLVGSFGAGVWERRGSRWRAYTVADGLPSNEVSALLRERGGRVWAATRDGGLAWRDGDRFQRFRLPIGACDQNIAALAEDTEGGLWMGTEFCGLHRLQDRPIHTISRREGLPIDSVLGLAGASNGTVWVGTRGGGMARIAGSSRAQPIACGNDLPCGSCWDIAPGPDDTFSAICGTNDLLRWDGRSMTRARPDGLEAADMLAMARDGALWFAQGTSVVRSLAGAVTRVTAQEGLRGKRVLHEGPTGTIWIAADDGVAAWRNGAVSISRFDGEREVSTLHEDRTGALWVGTKGAGLRVLRRGRAVSIGVGNGLPTGWIIQILEDDYGRLWMSTDRGILSVNKRDIEDLADGRSTRVQPNLYDGADGVLMRADSFGHPAGWKGRDGRLWFATMGGVVVVDPPAPRTQAPRVLIEEMRVGGQRIPIRPGVVLGPGAVDLQIRFSAVSLAGPESMQFRYRLEGKDSVWTDADSSRSLHYAQLSPGRYHLAIQARHRHGDWSGGGARLAFVVRPRFYRSPWFVLSCALGAGLLLTLAHRLRLSRARAGLQAVMAERSRIARDIHDTLAQAFVATSVQLECLDQALENGDRSTIHRHLENARRMVRESLDEARRSVWLLRPQSLERGLPAALETLVGGASGETVVELELTGTPRPLPTLVESNLLRVGQEAVANAYRHARAQRIVVRLSYAPGLVRLSVVDDGMGLGEGALPAERGLAGMRERVAEVGGTLSIEGGQDGGTEIRAEVPA